jgi:hypothetical protein
MRLEKLKFGEGGCGASQGAGYIKQMAGTGGGAKQSSSTGNGANEDDVSDGDGRFRQISTGKGGLVSRRQSKQAVEE